MPAPNRQDNSKLPGRFDELVRRMSPRAIADDASYENTTGMIDRLMSSGRLNREQEAYLETLVQLVQAYEAERQPVQKLKGVPMLKHLLAENEMNASDLARLLGVHASMGSKILNRERALTVDHLKRLAARFKVAADTFID